MPYIVVPKDDPREPSDFQPSDTSLMEMGLERFTRRADAFAAASTRPEPSKVLYIPTWQDADEWTNREILRFRRAAYEPVPWAGEAYKYPRHFAHIALTEKGKIAYTPDDESGYQDRQVRMRPGRYLEQFYADVPLHVRQKWIDIVMAATAPASAELQIARTADEIEAVYTSIQNFVSCMKGDDWDDVHPVRVYGDSDLAVAYLGTPGPDTEITARSVIWPAEKTFYRVFGIQATNGENTLRRLLLSHGYTEGSFRGARIRAITHCDGCYVMPYVDGITSAKYVGNGWIELGEGPLDCDRTDGRSSSGSQCERCDEPCPSDESYCESCEDMRQVCDNCEGSFFDNRRSRSTYCETCRENVVNCDSCNEDTFDRTYEDGDGNTNCRGCATEHRSTCVSCGYRWYELTLLPGNQRRRVDNGCANGQVCEGCEADKIVEPCEATTTCLGMLVRESEDDPVPACPSCGLTSPTTVPDDGAVQADLLVAGSSEPDSAPVSPLTVGSSADLPVYRPLVIASVPQSESWVVIPCDCEHCQVSRPRVTVAPIASAETEAR